VGGKGCWIVLTQAPQGGSCRLCVGGDGDPRRECARGEEMKEETAKSPRRIWGGRSQRLYRLVHPWHLLFVSPVVRADQERAILLKGAGADPWMFYGKQRVRVCAGGVASDGDPRSSITFRRDARWTRWTAIRLLASTTTPAILDLSGRQYVKFLYGFSDRIFHVHMKDVYWSANPSVSASSAATSASGIPGGTGDFRSLRHQLH